MLLDVVEDVDRERCFDDGWWTKKRFDVDGEKTKIDEVVEQKFKYR